MARSKRPLVCVPLVVLLAACGSSTSARPWPVLGSSEKAVSAAWSVDPSTEGCTRVNLETTCHYVYRGVRIAVSFDEHQVAEQFQTDGKKHRGVDMWQFLNSLVPKGSRRLSCRLVPHSTGGGTARACLYHVKQDIIVAYFPHPSDTDFGGLVTSGYAE